MAWPLVRLWRWLWRRGPTRDQARQLFRLHREHLEAAFLQAAAISGKPRGLRWSDCDWNSGDIAFARERATGNLAVLVGITIHFEAIPGGDMEDVPAVGLPRIASAVFFFHDGRWQTTGRALFNLSPEEALLRFQNQYERLPATETEDRK